MKSKLLFFVLLAIPGCSAYIEVRPLGTVKSCPYSKDEFVKRVTLDGLKEYIQQNGMATAACFKHIEEDYEEALDVFVTNMTDVTCKVGTLFSDYEKPYGNFPFYVPKSIKDMGKQIKMYFELMKTAFGRGEFEKVKQYDKTIKEQIIDEGYDSYLKNLGHLLEKISKEESDKIQNLVHVNCSPGMKMLEGVDKEFEKCIKGRLAETEKYLQSLNNKKN